MPNNSQEFASYIRSQLSSVSSNNEDWVSHAAELHRCFAEELATAATDILINKLPTSYETTSTQKQDIIDRINRWAHALGLSIQSLTTDAIGKLKLKRYTPTLDTFELEELGPGRLPKRVDLGLYPTNIRFVAASNGSPQQSQPRRTNSTTTNRGH